LPLRVARSTRRLYSASESVTVPGEPAAGSGTSSLVFLCWPAATTVITKISISAFIAHLAFSHVESQTQLPAFGSQRSTPKRRRPMGQSVETSRAKGDCEPVACRVYPAEVWRPVVLFRPGRQESRLPLVAVQLMMHLLLNVMRETRAACRCQLGNLQSIP